MTRAYRDVEAVSRLLEEKEKDLELAAKIGQELLERNRFLDEKVLRLEAQLSAAAETVTQLRHEVQVKTDLLRVYSDDPGDDDDEEGFDLGMGSLGSKNVNVELLKKKIQDLQVNNKKLQEEATVLANEAFDVEEKEDRLVSETVKHLTEANFQINFLAEEFSHKSDESRKQKEEITHLLAQICDLQVKSKSFGRDNDELRTSLCAYKETQDELTTELSDFKEKYREVVDLLHDAQEDLRRARKRTYVGLGQHSINGMFGSSPQEAAGADGDKNREASDEFSSLQSEIHSSLRSSKRSSKKPSLHSSRFDSDDSDYDHRPRSSGRTSGAAAAAGGGGSVFSRTFDTYRCATVHSKMLHVPADSTTSPVPISQGYNPGQGSSLNNSVAKSGSQEYAFDSYTISRDELDYAYTADMEFRGGKLLCDSTDGISEISDHLGGHPGIGSLPNISLNPIVSSSPKRGHPGLGAPPASYESRAGQQKQLGEGELRVRTIGELHVPEAAMGAPLSTPLGSVPGGFRRRQDMGSLPEGMDVGPTIGSLSDGSFGEFTSATRRNPGLGSIGSIPEGLGMVPGLGAISGGMGTLPSHLGSVPTGGQSTSFSGLLDFRSRGLSGANIASSSASEATQTAMSITRARTLTTSEGGVMSSDGKVKPGIGDRRSLDNTADGMSDDGKGIEGLGGFEEGDFVGGLISSYPEKTTLSDELEKVLQKLNPAEVERERRQKTRGYSSYDLGSDGFESPGSLMGKPGFHFLPYGVRTPDSIMSTGSREIAGSFAGYSGYGAGWKLPDKLRIVKPLEGSLTLHHWQRLAMPHLGNLLEESSGIAVKGTTIEEVMEDFALSDYYEEDKLDDLLGVFVKQENTRTHQTFTDCTILHPDDASSTQLTSSYGKVQMSSGFGDMSRSSSRMSSRSESSMSSRRQSISEPNPYRRGGTLTFSSNIGLARVLNERHIHGYLSSSSLSLENTGVNSRSTRTSSEFGGGGGSLCSLTPSVISTPAGERSFTPTGTPLNSPTHSSPGTPPNERRESGMVLGFFASLKAALYGEQRKEESTLIRQKRLKPKLAKFGILEKVEEVGVENLLSASPHSSYALNKIASYSSQDSEDSTTTPVSSSMDRDELEEIKPGMLTLSSSFSSSASFGWDAAPQNLDPTVGQLSAPTFSMYSRPSLSSKDFGQVPPGSTFKDSGRFAGRDSSALVGGRGPGRVITSPGESRPQLMGALGVPGTPGTGALRLQVPGNLMVRPDLGSVPVMKSPEDESPGFIGNITTMFFGRKGGLW